MRGVLGEQSDLWIFKRLQKLFLVPDFTSIFHFLDGGAQQQQ